MIEGLPAVALGVAAYIFLSDQPSDASWLSVEDKARVESDLAVDHKLRTRTTRSFGAALRDPKVYLLAFIYFAFFCSLNTILLWAPTLLKRVGVATATEIGLLSGAISVVSAIEMVAVGHSSDRMMERRWHLALCGLTAAACFLLMEAVQGSIVWTTLLLAVACMLALVVGVPAPSGLSRPGRTKPT